MCLKHREVMRCVPQSRDRKAAASGQSMTAEDMHRKACLLSRLRGGNRIVLDSGGQSSSSFLVCAFPFPNRLEHGR